MRRKAPILILDSRALLAGLISGGLALYHGRSWYAATLGAVVLAVAVQTVLVLRRRSRLKRRQRNFAQPS